MMKSQAVEHRSLAQSPDVGQLRGEHRPRGILSSWRMYWAFDTATVLHAHLTSHEALILFSKRLCAPSVAPAWRQGKSSQHGAAANTLLKPGLVRGDNATAFTEWMGGPWQLVCIQEGVLGPSSVPLRGPAVQRSRPMGPGGHGGERQTPRSSFIRETCGHLPCAAAPCSEPLPEGRSCQPCPEFFLECNVANMVGHPRSDLHLVKPLVGPGGTEWPECCGFVKVPHSNRYWTVKRRGPFQLRWS